MLSSTVSKSVASFTLEHLPSQGSVPLHSPHFHSPFLSSLDFFFHTLTHHHCDSYWNFSSVSPCSWWWSARRSCDREILRIKPFGGLWEDDGKGKDRSPGPPSLGASDPSWHLFSFLQVWRHSAHDRREQLWILTPEDWLEMSSKALQNVLG